MRRAFVKYLIRDVKEQGIAWTTQNSRDLNAQIDKLVSEDAKSLDGRAEKYHLELACLVLASYQFLVGYSSISAATREKILLSSLMRPNQKSIQWGTKIMLALTRDPMRTLVNYSRKRLPAMYGKIFAFSQEGDENSVYTMRVTRCFYHQFFTRHGQPELTRLFCEWDRNWIDPISEAKHKVRFTRAETIATDGESCPFTFERLD